jgi:hypothetical protein
MVDDLSHLLRIERSLPGDRRAKCFQNGRRLDDGAFIALHYDFAVASGNLRGDHPADLSEVLILGSQKQNKVFGASYRDRCFNHARSRRRAGNRKMPLCVRGLRN